MKNIIVISLVILSFTSIFAQNQISNSIKEKSFDARYGVEYIVQVSDTILKDEELKDKRKKLFATKYNQRLKRVVSLSKKLDFKLNFNVRNSFFRVEDYMANNQRDADYLNVLLKYKGSYYSYNGKNLQAKNSFGKDFLVEYPRFNWNITSESRKIGNYICYKATLVRHVKNARGDFEYKVTAWFAPELPFNFGPKEYNGLPGLIVELNEGDKIIFKLKKINQVADVIIKLPRKSKEISLKDFDALSEKMFTSLRKKN